MRMCRTTQMLTLDFGRFDLFDKVDDTDDFADFQSAAAVQASAP